MKTRVISACVLIILVVVCFALSPITRILFLLAALIMGIWEMCHAISFMDIKCASWVLYVYAVLACAGIYLMAGNSAAVLLFFLAVFAVFMAGIIKPEISGSGTLAGLAVLVYPTVPFLIIMELSLRDDWIAIFAVACISTWVCDSFALFGGKWFGKNKLAPKVSPNKTIEGSVTGAIAATLAGIGLYFALKSSFDISLLRCMLTALVCSSFGQVGDLAASLIKRMTGLKDYSNLIPGHGGVMDRVDSLLFSIPAAFFCLGYGIL